MKIKDLTGQNFGRLTVLKLIGTDKHQKAIWQCQCDCDKKTIVNVVGCSLTGKKTYSCGCLRLERTIENGRRNAVDYSYEIYNNLMFIESTDKRSGNQVVWKLLCLCGKTCEIRASSVVSGISKTCGRCHLLKDEYPNLIEEWDFEKNKELDLNDITCHTAKSVWWICKKCGHNWKTRVYSRSKGSGCPNCHSPSKANDRFKRILEEDGIEFEQEKRLEGCKYKLPLRFDFYFPTLNILVELQGEQHYKKGRYKDAEKYFELVRIRDQIKREYCKKNNIRLIEIHYCDFSEKRMKEILKEEGIING